MTEKALLAMVKAYNDVARRHRVAHSLCFSLFCALKDSKVYPHLLMRFFTQRKCYHIVDL